MLVSESVVLPLPQSAQAIREAAVLYTEQYGVVAKIEMRGGIRLKDGFIYVISAWTVVHQLDDELDLLGLGDCAGLEAYMEDDGLLWVFPLEGEFRLSELEEEN